MSGSVLVAWALAGWLDKPWWGLIFLTIPAMAMARICWNTWGEFNELANGTIKEMGKMSPTDTDGY
jgi:hypothetical protein